MDELVDKLIGYCLGIKRQEASKELYEEYLEDIESITPQLLFKVMNRQLEMASPSIRHFPILLDGRESRSSKCDGSYAWIVKRP